MINIVDIDSMRDNIKSYIIDKGYFSDYDIDVNDIVQMIIDIFSYSTSTLSTQLVQQENNLLLYQTEDPDMIMNLMPLFGYSPNFGSPMSGKIELYLNQQTISNLNKPIQNTGKTLLELLSDAGMNQLLVLTRGSNINISTPVITSNSNTVAQTLNWIVQDNVYLYQNDLQQQINNVSTCPLKTQNGGTTIQIVQQQLINLTFNQVQGTPFEKFILEQSIQRKTQIVNNDLITNLSFKPSVNVSLNNNSQTWNIYSSILDSTGDLDNFIMFYLDPVTMSLYAQQGDDILNGNTLPEGQTITISFYETYGNNVLNSANVLSGTINKDVQIPGTLVPYSLSMDLIQSTKLYGGLSFKNINQIKKNALIVGNINNRLVTQRDFISYTNYYLTNYLSYNYSTVNVYSSFGENSLYITPIVAQTNLVGSVEMIESWEQSLLKEQLISLAPMTTYINVQNPNIYNIQTTGSAITIYTQSGINIDSVIPQFEQTLNNYFTIDSFNIFNNFDILDFITQVNKLLWIDVIDYNSVVNQMCLTDLNGKVVSTVDKTQNNSIIPLPSDTVFSALSIGNIKFSFQMYNTDGSTSTLANVTYNGSTVTLS